MDPRVLAFQFQIGSFVLDRNLAGVDHAQSLLAVPTDKSVRVAPVELTVLEG